MKNKLTHAVLEQMRQIYYNDISKNATGYLDWMGYPIDNENTPSYHHIERAAKQRHTTDIPTIENGAYLGEYSHQALHAIEKIDKDLYNRWNNIFRRIISEAKYPSDEIWLEIKQLQEESMALFDEPKTKKKSHKR